MVTRRGGAQEDVAAMKPAPDAYLRAAALLGLPPARCAAVEDSRTGVRIGCYPIVAPVMGELKSNRTYGLSVYGFYF